MKRSLRIFLLSSLGIAGILTLVLGIHIYIVTAKPDPSFVNTRIQLGRINFQQNLSTADVTIIEQQLQSLSGVKNTYFNTKENILVYAYDRDKNSSEKIYADLMKSAPYKAERYIVPANAQAGCPAMAGNTSLFRRVGTYMHQILD